MPARRNLPSAETSVFTNILKKRAKHYSLICDSRADFATFTIVLVVTFPCCQAFNSGPARTSVSPQQKCRPARGRRWSPFRQGKPRTGPERNELTAQTGGTPVSSNLEVRTQSWLELIVSSSGVPRGGDLQNGRPALIRLQVFGKFSSTPTPSGS